MELWIETAKLLTSIATPVIVVILGVLLLRRIEEVKSHVLRQSDFHKKWSDEFFLCCQQFMQTLERELSLLNFIVGLDNPDGELGSEIKEEISQLNIKLPELELRIRRSVIFAPSSGGEVVRAAKECLTLTGQLLKKKHGNLDQIISKMNEFNLASRKAHAEILGLKSKSP